MPAEAVPPNRGGLSKLFTVISIRMICPVYVTMKQ
jgi:hypothetical protein